MAIFPALTYMKKVAIGTCFVDFAQLIDPHDQKKCEPGRIRISKSFFKRREAYL
jgi:hypothetical protein